MKKTKKKVMICVCAAAGCILLPVLIAGLLLYGVAGHGAFHAVSYVIVNFPELYKQLPGALVSNQYEKKGREIMTEYLADNFPNAKLTSCLSCDIPRGEQSYCSDYVRGIFEIEGEAYTYYVNVYTEDVYTTYYEKEIEKRIYTQICEKLGIENYRIEFDELKKTVSSVDDPSSDAYTFGGTLQVPIPGNIQEDDLDEFIEEMLSWDASRNGYEANLTIIYSDDIRIENMDFNQLSEEFQRLNLTMNHIRREADPDSETVIRNLEQLSYVIGAGWNYISYNVVERDDILLVYEEYSDTGSEDVKPAAADEIKPDNFTIKKDDEKIEIQLKEPVKYYLYLSDLDFLGAKGLYEYQDKFQRYCEIDLIEDWGMGRYAVYASGAWPHYYEKSETFYIGMPAAKGDSQQAQP